MIRCHHSCNLSEWYFNNGAASPVESGSFPVISGKGKMPFLGGAASQTLGKSRSIRTFPPHRPLYSTCLIQTVNGFGRQGATLPRRLSEHFGTNGLRVWKHGKKVWQPDKWKLWKGHLHHAWLIMRNELNCYSKSAINSAAPRTIMTKTKW